MSGQPKIPKSDACHFYVLGFDRDEAGCGRVRVTDRPPQFGVFFDGTGNNLYNDIARWDDDKAPTNIAKLYLLYPDQKEIFVSKTYIHGIGTTAGMDDDDIDMGIAYSFGDKVRQALEETKGFFAAPQFANAPLGILDVFGFSRGAAAARHFVNEVHRFGKADPKYFGGPQLQVRFLGLFDTVGSIGVAGDDSQVDIKGERFNLHLHPRAAQHVYHLTARHEQREYFPLNSILTGPGQAPAAHFEEVELPGAHADVGGGYGPGPDMVYYPVEKVGWSMRGVLDDKLAELKREYEQRYYAPGIDIEMQVIDDTGAAAGRFSTVAPRWRRQVKPHLAHVALRRMYERATGKGVPLEPLDMLMAKPEFKGRKREDIYVTPSDLAARAAAAGRGDPDAEEYLLRHYIHHSHQYRARPKPGVLPSINANKPEANPRRPAPNGRREIFPNAAARGNAPDSNWQRERYKETALGRWRRASV